MGTSAVACSATGSACRDRCRGRRGRSTVPQHLERLTSGATPGHEISISLGAHGAIFFSSPSLLSDVPRTPGTRWMES
jgi:hypothetical protein